MGREEEEVEGESGEGVVDRPDSAEAEETRRKMAELEAKIKEACSEENFDLAGTLCVSLVPDLSCHSSTLLFSYS